MKTSQMPSLISQYMSLPMCLCGAPGIKLPVLQAIQYLESQGTFTFRHGFPKVSHKLYTLLHRHTIGRLTRHSLLLLLLWPRIIRRRNSQIPIPIHIHITISIHTHTHIHIHMIESNIIPRVLLLLLLSSPRLCIVPLSSAYNILYFPCLTTFQGPEEEGGED